MVRRTQEQAPTGSLTEADLGFLAEPRIGVLISSRADGRPLGVPVWFDWNGATVEMFSAADAPKTRRLRHTPFASLLVTNRVGEPEHWIAFDGAIEVTKAGGFELAEKLAARYWNPAATAHLETLDQWRDHRDAFCRLTLTPERIRTGS
jgi:hypothetical protein